MTALPSTEREETAGEGRKWRQPARDRLTQPIHDRCHLQDPENFLMSSALDALPWFAVQVKYRMEKGVAGALESKGYKPFVPTREDRPLFPGYVFCRADAEQRGLIVTTPGVRRIVSFGGSYCTIPHAEIEAIRSIEASGLPAMPCRYLRIEDRVRILEGPLRGVEGSIVQFGKKGVLVISVELLQRSVAVTVDLDTVVLSAQRVLKDISCQSQFRRDPFKSTSLPSLGMLSPMHGK